MKFLRNTDANGKTAIPLPREAQDMLKALEADWRTMTGTETEFGAGRIDPRVLDRALPYAFVLQRMSPGVFRTRVAGQRLHDMLRMDPRGMPFASFFTQDAREAALHMAEMTLDTPAIVSLPLLSSGGLGRRALRAEALLLPMRDANGDLTRIMGAIVTGGDIGNRSHRFAIASNRPVRCDHLMMPFPNRRNLRGRTGDQTPKWDGLAAAKSVTTTPKAPVAPVAPVTQKPAAAGFGLRLVVDNT